MPRKKAADTATTPTQRDIREAERTVDTMHAMASRQDDPVSFMRDQLRQAEDAYAHSGDAGALALVRALESSLNGPTQDPTT